jgi:hypothetical protein
VGFFSPLASSLFTFSSEMYWTYGSSTPPNDNRAESFDCPFDPDTLEPSQSGKVIAYVTTISLFLIIAVMSACIWRKLWRFGVITLEIRKEISQSDVMLMALIVVEFFQITALGPEFSDVSTFVTFISKSLSVDITNLIEMK